MNTKLRLLKLRLAAVGDILPTKFRTTLDPAYGKDILMSPGKFLNVSSGDTGKKMQETLDDAHSNKYSGERPYKVRERDWDRIHEEGTKYKDPMTTDTNYNVRGDELGGVEHYKRKIRRGDVITTPDLSISSRKKEIIGHEGRHRARALMEEGEKKIPVNVNAYSGGRANELGVGLLNRLRTNLKGIKSQYRGDVDKTLDPHRGEKDTRAPIFGRYSKQRVAIKTRHSVKMNPEHGRMIADAYDNLQHTPNDTRTQEAYKAFSQETLQQFNDLRSKGLQIRKLKSGEPGYTTAEDMHKDITENNHLSYFPTEEGYGTDEKPAEHPMLQGSGVVDADGKEIPFNDIFRIVHDVNGHNLGDMSDFSAEGEHAAFLTHRQQYSPIAQRALFTETAGQSNWGAFNKVSGLDNLRKIAAGKHNELVFPEQKAGLLPDEIIFGKWHGE